VQSEELLMKNFCLVVDHDPERLALAIPAIVPLEVGNEVDLDFQDCSGDRLAHNLDVEVRNVGSKLVEFVLRCWWEISLCLVKLLVVDHVQSDVVLS